MSCLLRVRFICALIAIFAFFGVSSVAAADWPPTVYIRNFQVKLLGKQALTGDEQAISETLPSGLAEQLLKRYPCARILTENDFRSMITWDRQRALLGTPDEDLALDKILEAFGKAIVIDGSLVGTVNSYNLTLRVVNGVGENAKMSKSVKSKNGPLTADSFFELRDEIGKDLRLGICTWDGTITLKIKGNDQENITESDDSGSARHSVTQGGELTLEVTWKGERENREESQSASYTCKYEKKEEGNQNRVFKDCLSDNGQFVDKSYHSSHRSTASASKSGNVEGRTASITLNPKTHEFEIRVDVPNVDVEMAVTWEDNEEGGCAGVKNRSGDSYKHPVQLIGAQSFSVKDYFNSKEGRLKGEKKLEDVALFPYNDTPNEGTISYDLKRR